jgi:gas vesicle structural protein
MPVERTSSGTSLIDVLDRVLDKGIVIDAWVRASPLGIDLAGTRVVVASVDTFHEREVGREGAEAARSSGTLAPSSTSRRTRASDGRRSRDR